MKIALLNPPWSFEGSIYFGCREPHLPLELGYCAACSRPTATRCCCWTAPRRPRRSPASPNGGAVRARTSRCVTTAPTYLFWRCAQPELRVPARRSWRRCAAAAAARSRSGRTARRRPARRSPSSAATWSCMGECEEVVARSSPAAPTGATTPGHRVLARRRRRRITGGPRAGRFVDLPALRWPDAWIAAHRHHHHRFERARRTGRAPRSRPRAAAPTLHLLRQARLPRHATAAASSTCVLDEIDGLIAQGVDLPLLRRRDLPAAARRCSRRWSTRPVRVRRADPDRPVEAGAARAARRGRLRLDRGRRREPDRARAAPRSTRAAG